MLSIAFIPGGPGKRRLGWYMRGSPPALPRVFAWTYSWDLGPDLDLVGITSSSSSVDLTCADSTDEAGADSAGDLSGDHT